MRFPLMIMTALLASACGTKESTIGFSGYQINDHFPLDGQRSWEYANDDITVPYKLDVRLSDLTTTNGDATVHEFQYYNQSTGDLLRTVQWSSDSADGVLIHGFKTYIDGALDQDHDFTADPVIFADSTMAPGDVEDSEGGGWSFLSTFEGEERCPNYWTEASDSEEWTCLRFYLDDGVDTDGAAIAGTYWIAPRYGTSWVQLDDDPDLWRLTLARWESE